MNSKTLFFGCLVSIASLSWSMKRDDQVTHAMALWNKNPHVRLVHAIRAGNLQEIQAALDAGVHINTNISYSDEFPRATPLHIASRFGTPEVVKLLLEKGADVNAHRDGWTPLHEAASRGKSEIVLLLLQYGADSSIRNKQGKTAADIARDNNQQDTVFVLSVAQEFLGTMEKE